MDGAATAPSFARLAEMLLDHRLSSPNLSAAGAAGGAESRALLCGVFRDLVEVFALDRAIAAGKTLDEMLHVVAGALGQALQARECRIVLRGEDGGYFWLKAEGGIGDEIRVDVAQSLTAAAIADGVARAFARPARLPGVPATDWPGGHAPQTLACAPLQRVDGDIVGAVQIFDKSDGPFDDRDLALATAAGTVMAELAAASGLAQGGSGGARLVERIEVPERKAGHEMILAKILAAAREILAADRGWIFLYDNASDELFTCLAEGLDRYELRVGLKSGIAGLAYRTGETINIADAYQDPRFNPAID
ncbi:MAG: GAF domain-containing protein, partial [Stellaceae bacterium]